MMTLLVWEANVSHSGEIVMRERGTEGKDPKLDTTSVRLMGVRSDAS